ncbi:unnamed protein product [Schistocephalus solidus]|uniref:Uncharacterized protein n=1 Tax=Schistocephalus solidus TaxID=70667 RepID=A0A183TL34_SCHSO|nr:unnamed protein product [Schistocephalus solidus]
MGPFCLVGKPFLPPSLPHAPPGPVIHSRSLPVSPPSPPPPPSPTHPPPREHIPLPPFLHRLRRTPRTSWQQQTNDDNNHTADVAEVLLIKMFHAHSKAVV